MVRFPAILALFVLLAFTTSTTTAAKKNPCKPVCLGYKNWNKSTCPWKYCTHKTCRFKTKWGKWKKGHRCTPKDTSPPPPTTCADKCYRRWKDANKGCNLSICKLSGCRVLHKGKRVWGHRCTPNVIIDPPPPPPPPATCNDKCYRWWREANNDCDRNICGITGCKGDGYWGFRCSSLVVKPTPSALPSVSSAPVPVGCPADCLRKWRTARERCDPERCMVVSCPAPWAWWRSGYRCIERPSPSTTSSATPSPSAKPSTSPYVPFCPRVCRRRWNAAAKGCDPRGCDVVRCSQSGSWWSFGYECAPKGASPMPSPSSVFPSIVPQPSSTSTAMASPSKSPSPPMMSTTATATATPSTSTVPSLSPSTPGSTCADMCRRRRRGAERNCDLTKCEIVECTSTRFTNTGFKCAPKAMP